MNHRFALSMTIVVCWASIVANLQRPTFANDRPNILLIISEDNGPELGCYGDRFATTPNLDRLAANGVRFETAYVTQSVCSPSRSSIFTGLYPHQNGQIGLATHQFTMFKEWPTTYSILKQAGYRTGLIGKTHVNPESVVEKWVDFRAIKSSNFAKKNLQDYVKQSARFINQSDQPFFLSVNFPDAHWPVQNQVQGRPKRLHDPDELRPMPYVGFDNPRLREHIAGFYNCMSRLDECVGQLLEALEASGKADNTMVIYLGDHGAQFARGKIFVTEAGLRIPLIIRWPGKTKPGMVSEQMVSTVDLLPTMVAAAGVQPPPGLPGYNLAPVLKAEDSSPLREYLFGERNCDAATLHYPQRAVRDSRYKLIKTLLPGRLDPAAHHCMINGASNFRGSPTYEELDANGSEATKKAYETWLNPPQYQLYDLDNDPHEFVNLAEDPELSATKQRLIEQLNQWQVKTDDKLRSARLLKRLTEEIESCLKNNIRSPKGGWNYVNYLGPDPQGSDSSSEKDHSFDSKMIWDAAAHNAFTDLVKWKGKIYCAFRIGTGHVPGKNGVDGRIQIISTVDGKRWSSVANLAEPGIDLRDPKLSVTPDGRLMVLMGGSNYDGTKLLDRATRVAFFENGNKESPKIQTVKIDPVIASDGDWLWRVTWQNGVGYGVVYQSNKPTWGLHLVKTNDGINYDRVKSFEISGKPNESTVRFSRNGNMHVVVRNESGNIGHLGIAKPPFEYFKWNRIKQRLGGPNILQLPDGSWLLGTREYRDDPKTILGRLLDDGSFEKRITFPSGGDTSYPGMIIHRNQLWFSYYSSHEGRTSIYLATVELADLLSSKSNVTNPDPDRRIVFHQRKIPAGVPLLGHAAKAQNYGYRIPSLLVTQKGSVLAFAERRIGLDDHAQNDIVLKRSVDSGKSWSK